MVQNFALAAIVALFATATLADTTEKKEEHTVEAGKDAKDAPAPAPEGKKEEGKQ